MSGVVIVCGGWALHAGLGGDVEVGEHTGAGYASHSVKEGMTDVAVISCFVERSRRDVVGCVGIGGHVELWLEEGVEVGVKDVAWRCCDAGSVGQVELICAVDATNSVEIGSTSTANGVVFECNDLSPGCQHISYVVRSGHPS